MSIEDKKQDAEAVLDSAEMVLETIPEPRTGKAKDLELEISKLEKEIQEPDSEESIEELIQSVRDLMEEVQDEAMQDETVPDQEMGGMGPGAPPGEPGDDVPPF
ncbi:MAG: hypothetical protein ABEJ56_03130 [Candidatus Nanohaloarchaea archaeon]